MVLRLYDIGANPHGGDCAYVAAAGTQQGAKRKSDLLSELSVGNATVTGTSTEVRVASTGGPRRRDGTVMANSGIWTSE
ncbi:hypothetical protein E2542_SST31568 [Spatholobus suberectus]|nr:hypothetical protein E2542_SST31568 [Spatholobus suberectus]